MQRRILSESFSEGSVVSPGATQFVLPDEKTLRPGEKMELLTSKNEMQTFNGPNLRKFSRSPLITSLSFVHRLLLGI